MAEPLTKLASRGNAKFFIRGESQGIQGEVLDDLNCYQLTLSKIINESRLSTLIMLTGLPFRVADKLTIEVVVDNEKIVDACGKLSFIDYVGNWFLEYIVTVVTTKAQLSTQKSPDNIARILNDVKRVRLVPAKLIKIFVENQELNPPLSFGNTFPFRSDDGLFIAVRGIEQMAKSILLQEVTPSLCHLLRISSITDSVKLGLIDLFNTNSFVDTSSSVGPELLAGIFNERTDRITEILSGIRADIELFYIKIVPIIKFFDVDNPSLGLSEDKIVLLSQDYFIESLCELMSKAGVTIPEKIKEILKMSESYYLLRDQLQLDFDRFNQVLISLGSPYLPELNKEDHHRCFEVFKKQNKENILKPVRQQNFYNYNQFDELVSYVQIRNLEDLKVDESWVEHYKEPPDELMWEQVKKWWRDNNINYSDFESIILENLKTVLEKNREEAKKFQQEFYVLVGSWCQKNGSDCPAWADSRASEEFEVFNILNSKGCLDFSFVNADDIVSWLLKFDFWPKGMSSTKDLEKLGLTDDDIDEYLNADKIIKKQKEYEKNRIELDGEFLSGKEDSYSTLVKEVLSNISDSFLSSSKNVVSLENARLINMGTGVGGAGGGGGNGGRVVHGLNATKLKAIGLMGEVLAFEWLKFHYKDSADESCWKSGYRNHILGGTEGDDTLGYDFMVPLKSRNLYFEVKSTTGDYKEIMLGETEIRAAQTFHSENKDHFRILFITNVNNSMNRTISVLPNPFSKNGRDKFRAVGKGIKYRFDY